MTVMRGRPQHAPRQFDWRLFTAGAWVCLAAILVLLHFICRQAAGSLVISSMLPWVGCAIGVSLCATLLPLACPRDVIAEHIPVSSLFAGIGIALAFAFLGAGTDGMLGTLQAIRIALTSQ